MEHRERMALMYVNKCVKYSNLKFEYETNTDRKQWMDMTEIKQTKKKKLGRGDKDKSTI